MAFDLGTIFFAGMATTYLLQKTKVLGAENRVFNAPQNCVGNRSDIHGLTPDGYYTNNPNATSTNYADDYYTITQPSGRGPYRTTYYQFHQNGTKTLRHSVTYNLNMAKGVAHDNRPWKDMASGQCEAVNGKLSMGSGQWEVSMGMGVSARRI